MMHVISLFLAFADPQAPASTTPTAPTSPASAAAGRTLLQYISDGGMISYFLIILSMVAVALMIRSALVLRRVLFLPDALMREITTLAQSGDITNLSMAAGRSDAFAPRVIYGGLRRAIASPLGMMELRNACEEELNKDAERLHRMNDVLAIIAAVAPMMGLLGTVIGMIGAFGSISSLQGAARSNELARFMSMALVNTAEGLVIAIPATVVFGLCRRRIEALIDECGDAIEPIAALLQRGGTPLPKPPAPAIRPPPPPARVPAAQT